MAAWQWNRQMHVLAAASDQTDACMWSEIIRYAEATAELDLLADEPDARTNFLCLGSKNFFSGGGLWYRDDWNAWFHDASFFSRN